MGPIPFGKAALRSQVLGCKVVTFPFSNPVYSHAAPCNWLQRNFLKPAAWGASTPPITITWAVRKSFCGLFGGMCLPFAVLAVFCSECWAVVSWLALLPWCGAAVCIGCCGRWFCAPTYDELPCACVGCACPMCPGSPIMLLSDCRGGALGRSAAHSWLAWVLWEVWPVHG